MRYRSSHRLVASLAALTAVMAGGVRICAAYSVFGHWDSTTSSIYPVVPARACPNQYATFFTAPWDAIRRQFLSAANEWFTSGGADVRVRLQGDLAASDPRCSNTAAANPNNGEILVTAEKNNGGGACFLATTFWWNNGGHIQRAKVIMHSGTACTGTYQAYPWSNGDFPTAQQYDFWSVFQHELGHAIGFDHSSVAGAVMAPSGLQGSIQNRSLSTDERLGLRSSSGYPRILTQSQHRRSIDDGATWLDEGEPFAMNVIGAPAPCLSSSTGNYLVASTRALDDTVVTYWTNGVSSSSFTVLPLQSHLPPAVACSSGTVVLAAVANDAARTVYVTTSSNGVNWSVPQSVGVSSSLPPALTYADWHGTFILVTTDIASGSLRTQLSSSGTSWAATQLWPFHTSTAYGIGCRGGVGYCDLGWADAERSYTPVRSAALGFLPLPAMGLASLATIDLGYNSYGGGVASNGSRFQRTWRDRGTPTVLTSGGWSSWPPSLAPLTFTGTIMHAAPNLAWGSPWAEWSSWYSVATRYNQ